MAACSCRIEFLPIHVPGSDRAHVQGTGAKTTELLASSAATRPKQTVEVTAWTGLWMTLCIMSTFFCTTSGSLVAPNSVQMQAEGMSSTWAASSPVLPCSLSFTWEGEIFSSFMKAPLPRTALYISWVTCQSRLKELLRAEDEGLYWIEHNAHNWHLIHDKCNTCTFLHLEASQRILLRTH